jgi:hypothetical protein
MPSGHMTRCIAAAMLSLLVAFPFLSAVHFLFVPHAVDARTGKVVHLRCCATEDEPSSDSKNSDSPGRSSSRETCRIFALLHTVKAVTLPDAQVPPANSFIEPAVFGPDIYLVTSRQLYLLSPSHSPPVLS